MGVGVCCGGELLASMVGELVIDQVGLPLGIRAKDWSFPSVGMVIWSMDVPLMAKLSFAPDARRLLSASGKRTRYPSGAIAAPWGK